MLPVRALTCERSPTTNERRHRGQQHRIVLRRRRRRTIPTRSSSRATRSARSLGSGSVGFTGGGGACPEIPGRLVRIVLSRHVQGFRPWRRSRLSDTLRLQLTSVAPFASLVRIMSKSLSILDFGRGEIFENRQDQAVRRRGLHAGGGAVRVLPQRECHPRAAPGGRLAADSRAVDGQPAVEVTYDLDGLPQDPRLLGSRMRSLLASDRDPGDRPGCARTRPAVCAAAARTARQRTGAKGS